MKPLATNIQKNCTMTKDDVKHVIQALVEEMRFINLIIIHCSESRHDRSHSEYNLTTEHLLRKFSGAGYHYYIRKNGDIKSLTSVENPGLYAKSHNANSIGICYEGGLDENGRPADTRTPFQKHSLRVLVMLLLRDYPGCRLCGHQDLRKKPSLFEVDSNIKIVIDKT